MDATPKNQSTLTPQSTTSASGQPTPGERLWILRKGTARMDAELRDNTAIGAGAELQLFRDGVFIYGRRHASRELALEESDGCRRQFEADGWATSP